MRKAGAATIARGDHRAIAAVIAPSRAMSNSRRAVNNASAASHQPGAAWLGAQNNCVTTLEYWK